MIDINTIKLSLPDILLLLGAAQSLYIIVYLLFRSGRISRGTIPLVYFLNLSLAFMLGFVNSHLPSAIPETTLIQSILWALQPPLCVLLIVQVAQIYKVPSWKHYWVLLAVPLAYITAKWGVEYYYEDCALGYKCTYFSDWFQVTSLTAGAISFISLLFNWEIIAALTKDKKHKERYWLVLALLFTNTAFIATMLLNAGFETKDVDFDLIMSLFGLVLVYLSGTSLFRIYPQAVRIATEKTEGGGLTVWEQSVAEKVEELILIQKVHHEPTYSRSDMARECKVPEGSISKIINTHFGKSFPTLLNEMRIEDAKQLLKQTEEPMTVIAKEAGFNSLATFNRVFKGVVGCSPSVFRGDCGF